MIDIAIIGAGPAGMSAAIYSKRAGLDVTVFEGEIIGGQMTTTPEIQNVAGFGSITGWELSKKMSSHLTDLDIPIVGEEIIGFEVEKNVKKVISSKKVYEAKAVIIANGVKRRKLGCDGEERLGGKGVSYCAVCDGDFFKEKTVVVVGGGNSALEDALYLAEICKKVYLVHRRNEFRAEKFFVDSVMSNDNIEIITPATVEKIIGDERVEQVSINHNGEQKKLSADGVFIAVGLIADNEVYTKSVGVDEYGYIIADDKCKTDAEGVYAAGDTRQKEIRQVVTAMSDGAIAANSAIKYIHSISCKK